MDEAHKSGVSFYRFLACAASADLAWHPYILVPYTNRYALERWVVSVQRHFSRSGMVGRLLHDLIPVVPAGGAWCRYGLTALCRRLCPRRLATTGLWITVNEAIGLGHSAGSADAKGSPEHAIDFEGLEGDHIVTLYVDRLRSSISTSRASSVPPGRLA